MMANRETYTYSIDENNHIMVDLDSKVFKPTGTSEALIESILKYITKPGKILDLGCGSGVVGLALNKGGKATTRLYASDVSNDAVVLLKKNALKNNIECEVREGSIYEPWSGEKFDYIVDDISGISQEIATISPWFKKTSCEAGVDGTSLVSEAITGAPLHLSQGGIFFFPVLSLSNVKKIITHAHSVFNNVEKIHSQTWALPDDMKKHIHILEELKKKEYISYEEKFGLILWSTEIFVAYNPR